MSDSSYTYVIVGGGLAGASAIQGIREVDKKGTILLVGDEKHLPYDRPPLTKKLWFGQKKTEDIFIHTGAFYEENNVAVKMGTKIINVNIGEKRVTDDRGNYHIYDKLLLATGGEPRRLPIPGGELEGICYYRYLDDYLRTRERASEGSSALVIGGGFIGSEIAAALNVNKVSVTMLFPEQHLVSRIFPEDLGLAIQNHYVKKGIVIMSGDKPASIKKNEDGFLTETGAGGKIASDMVIIGIGIKPSVELAQSAGLETGNGIIVNEYLRTSDPDIFAAGDNAFFPYAALEMKTRVEHWDNALNQGKQAGRNMAGANEAFTYMPYFFSDLFEFGYEAVGEVSSELETFADWQKENDTGVIYYLKGGVVRGAMMCNVWGKVDAAREMIRNKKKVPAQDLQGAIK